MVAKVKSSTEKVFLSIVGDVYSLEFKIIAKVIKIAFKNW